MTKLTVCSALALCLAAGGAAQASTITDIPDTALIAKYLMIGMDDDGEADAIDVQNTELGADRQFLSDGSSVENSVQQAGPNTKDVFYQDSDRWESTSAPNGDAAPVFEGIDWSGNLAVTGADQGKFTLSDIDLFASHGVDCASTLSQCKSNDTNNTNYFPDQDTNSAGLVDNGVGVNAEVDLSDLLADLAGWKDFIADLDADTTITDNIENENRKDGNGPFATTFSDTNNDGLFVVDIDRGDSDFELNNSDWILDLAEGDLAIFRILGESNFNVSNSSILMGDDFTDGSAVNELGALFVKLDDGADKSSDSVFNMNNVVLNGIGIWDLVDIGDMTDDITEIVVNNGQGCAQFISEKIAMNDVRWNRCSYSAPEHDPDPDTTPVPVPAGLPLIVTGLAGFVWLRRRSVA